MSETTKYAYIDIVRGVAILLVILVHVGSIVPNLPPVSFALFMFGNLGVQVFFVASTLTLCLSMSNRADTDWIDFYIRRFFRIAPIFYCGIVFYFFWHLLKNYHDIGVIALSDGDTFTALIQNVFFVHGFSPANFNYLVPGAWSIGAEVAFYALFPPILLVVRRGAGPMIILFASAWALSVTAQVITFNLISPYLMERGMLLEPLENEGFSFIYANIFNQLPVFLTGCLAFLLIKFEVSRWHLLIAALVCLTSLALMISPMFQTNFTGAIYPTLAAIGFAIAIVWLANKPIAMNAITRGLICIGQLSFAIYIAHFAIVDLLHLALETLPLDQLVPPSLLLVLLFATALCAVTPLRSWFTSASRDRELTWAKG